MEAVASGLALGRLQEAVERFQHGVGHARGIPAEDAFGAIVDGLGSLDQRLERGVHGGGDPALEKATCSSEIGLPIEIPEGFLHAIDLGEGGIPGRNVLELFTLEISQVRRIFEQRIPPTLYRLVEPPFGPPDPLDGVSEDLGDMELVEGHVGFGQELPHALDEGGGHVAGDLGHGRRVAAVLAQEASKGGDHLVFATLRREHQAPGGHVEEAADVVVPLLGRGLVHADHRHCGAVDARDGIVDIVLDDPPYTIVRHAQEFGDIPHRRRAGHLQNQALHEQGETAVGACPRHRDQSHTATRAIDPWDASHDERLMLEEVHMPPPLLDGVVNSAVLSTAVRTRKAGTRLEIHLHLQEALLRTEVRTYYAPRRYQTKGGSEERVGVHAHTLAQTLDRQLPTDLGTEPIFISGEAIEISDA